MNKSEPVFGKSHSHGWDYKPFTWETFLNLRKWAETAANEIGYPIYLVGSVLYKEIPRDIDICVIVPLKDYEATYGELPSQEEVGIYLAEVQKKNFKYYFQALDALGKMHLDFKIYPDTWFVDRPRVLLGEPKNKNINK